MESDSNKLFRAPRLEALTKYSNRYMHGQNRARGGRLTGKRFGEYFSEDLNVTRLLITLLAVALSTTIYAASINWQHSGLDTIGQPTYVSSYTVGCRKPRETSYSVLFDVYDPLATSINVSTLALTDSYWTCAVSATNSTGVSDWSTTVSFKVVGGVVRVR